ncbi:hypothetical protein [Burkholderia sp. BCC1993]|uniref:hypothetical protein n=1 Tax=Burkholderia sp. BCC1993 TaxID=2817444 RepID=UPI002AAFAFEB|nr:hypothetical protein [Burkholderia sp. BCC1993]
MSNVEIAEKAGVEIKEEINAKADTELKSESAAKEKYKIEQRSRLEKIIVGGKDISGNTISNIYSRGDEYVIYEISGVSEPESFRVIVDTEIESDPAGLIKRFEAIKSELVDFRSILYKGVHDKSVKHRAANAVSTAIRGDIEKAKEIFGKITEQVTNEYQSILVGRLLYLSGALGLLCGALLASLVAYYFRQSQFVAHISALKSLLYAATFSGCGGLLSVSINFRDIQFERELKPHSYLIYGAQRIMLAGLCGIFTYMLIKSGILFSFLMKSDNPFIALMTVCAAAGFSETLIPNALRNLENKSD